MHRAFSFSKNKNFKEKKCKFEEKSDKWKQEQLLKKKFSMCRSVVMCFVWFFLCKEERKKKEKCAFSVICCVTKDNQCTEREVECVLYS